MKREGALRNGELSTLTFHASPIMNLLFKHIRWCSEGREHSGDLRIGRGRVLETGHGLTPHRRERVIDGVGYLALPGLINAHDHITFVQNSPYTDTGERYEHRHDWRRGLNGHTQLNYSGGASDNQKLWGELRFLIGGATSTIGSGEVEGFLRNLDRFEALTCY